MSKNRFNQQRQSQPQTDTSGTTQAVEDTKLQTEESSTTVDETVKAEDAEQRDVTERQSNQEVTDTAEATEQKEEPEVQPVAEDIPTTLPKEVRRLMNKIEMELTNYREAMAATRAIDPQEGAQWQYGLFQQLKAILNNPSQEAFKTEWNTVLAYFHRERDGIFNENYMFRFPQNWPGSTAEFTLYRRLVFLLIQTADPQTRAKKVQGIDLSSATESLNEDARSRLINFYG